MHGKHILSRRKRIILGVFSLAVIVVIVLLLISGIGVVFYLS